jgi:integrase/recombinase XerD
MSFKLFIYQYEEFMKAYDNFIRTNREEGKSHSYLHLVGTVINNFNKFFDLGYKIPIVKKEKKVHDILTKREFNRMIKASKHDRDKVILLVAYTSGLRVSELTNLRVETCMLDEGYLFVDKAKGNKQRKVYIPQITRDILRKFITATRQSRKGLIDEFNYVFLNRSGNKLSVRYIQRLVKKTAEDAKVYKNVTPHTFRRSFATNMVKKGVTLPVIQQLMGHESIEITRSYIMLDNSFTKKEVRKMNKFYDSLNVKSINLDKEYNSYVLDCVGEMLLSGTVEDLEYEVRDEFNLSNSDAESVVNKVKEKIGFEEHYSNHIITDLGGTDFLVRMRQLGYNSTDLSLGLGKHIGYVNNYCNNKGLMYSKLADVPFKNIKPTKEVIDKVSKEILDYDEHYPIPDDAFINFLDSPIKELMNNKDSNLSHIFKSHKKWYIEYNRKYYGTYDTLIITMMIRDLLMVNDWNKVKVKKIIRKMAESSVDGSSLDSYPQFDTPILKED